MARRHSIATHVVLATIAVASVVMAGYAINWRARVAFDEIGRSAAQASERARAQIEQEHRDQAARAQVRQSEIDRQEVTRIEAIHERERNEEAFTRLIAARAAHKAKAWQRFYRAPSYCSESATVKCANAFIRAKRAFEEKYARGDFGVPNQ